MFDMSDCKCDGCKFFLSGDPEVRAEALESIRANNKSALAQFTLPGRATLYGTRA